MMYCQLVALFFATAAALRPPSQRTRLPARRVAQECPQSTPPPPPGPTLPAKLQKVEARLRAAHDAAAAFAVSELFRGVADEIPEPRPCAVRSGAMPADLRGAILKNGPNPRSWGSGGGWLDGDGMVHAVVLGERPAYSRAWLRTEGFAKEADAGRKLFEGTLVAPHGYRLLANLAKNAVTARQPQKDTANTALLNVGGRLFGLMEQCRPTEFAVDADGRLETVEAGSTLGWIDAAAHPLSGGALTAHLHADAGTGETIGVTYSSTSQPFGRVDVVDSATGALKKTVGVEMRAPVMLHDSALTAGPDGFVVIFDLPLTVRPRRMLLDRFPVEYEAAHGGQLGLVKRSTGDVVWCPVETGIVLHAVNAVERSDGAVVVTALRSVPATPTSFIEAYALPVSPTCRKIGSKKTRARRYTPAFLYEWVLDVENAECVRERYLSATPCEFPCVDPRCVGADATYASATPRPRASSRFYDARPRRKKNQVRDPRRDDRRPEPARPARRGHLHRRGRQVRPRRRPGGPRRGRRGRRRRRRRLARAGRASEPASAEERDGSVRVLRPEPRHPSRRFSLVSEPTFVPKDGGRLGDGGWILAFVSKVEEDASRTSRLVILDGEDLGAGPACVLDLPADVPYGLHSCWVAADDLKPAAP